MPQSHPMLYVYCPYHITPDANMQIPNGRIMYPLASGNATSRPYPVKTHRTPGQSSHRVVLYSSDLAAIFARNLIIYRRHLSGSASRCRCRCHSRCSRAQVVWVAVSAAFDLCGHLGPHSICLSGTRSPSHLSHHFRLALWADCL